MWSAPAQLAIPPMLPSSPAAAARTCIWGTCIWGRHVMYPAADRGTCHCHWCTREIQVKQRYREATHGVMLYTRRVRTWHSSAANLAADPRQQLQINVKTSTTEETCMQIPQSPETHAACYRRRYVTMARNPPPPLQRVRGPGIMRSQRSGWLSADTRPAVTMAEGEGGWTGGQEVEQGGGGGWEHMGPTTKSSMGKGEGAESAICAAQRGRRTGLVRKCRADIAARADPRP